MLMLYTDDIWLSSITRGLLQRIILNCPGETTKDKQYLTYNVSGKSCQQSYQINDDQILQYGYIYASNITFSPTEVISGALGLGVSKNSFALAMKTRIRNEHSLYISNDPSAYSHILFGGKD
jgi:hypothetical protein